MSETNTKEELTGEQNVVAATNQSVEQEPQPEQQAPVQQAPPNETIQVETQPEKQTKAAAPKEIQTQILQEKQVSELVIPNFEATNEAKNKKKVVSVPDPYPHRHYFTIHPVANKLMAHKWDIHQREAHLKKLATMKSGGAATAPLTLNHFNKQKKVSQEQERQKEISRINKNLLLKMNFIHNTPSGISQREKVLKIPHSNIDQIRRDNKIKNENEAGKIRLERVRPQYNCNEWLESRLVKVRYLENIAAYPQKYIDLRKHLEAILAKNREDGNKSIEKSEKSENGKVEKVEVKKASKADDDLEVPSPTVPIASRRNTIKRAPEKQRASISSKNSRQNVPFVKRQFSEKKFSSSKQNLMEAK